MKDNTHDRGSIGAGSIYRVRHPEPVGNGDGTFLKIERHYRRSTSFRFFVSDENQKEKDRNPRVKAQRVSKPMDSGLFRADSHKHSINDHCAGSMPIASPIYAPARRNRNDVVGVCPRTDTV